MTKQVIINFSTIIYKAIISLKAIGVTVYRVLKTKEHLLEWTTAEEAEQTAKEDMACFIKEMWINVLSGVILLIISITKFNIFIFINHIHN